MLLLRAATDLPDGIAKKIALFASVPVDSVITALDVDSIYKVPLHYRRQAVDDVILDHFGLEAPPADLKSWEELIARIDGATDVVKIALVGKYIQLEDAYLSVAESLRHAGWKHGARVEIDWVDSEQLTSLQDASDRLSDADGILIPGGFGGRGVEGKILAAQYAREERVPYLGICLGMQIAVAEFARNVADMEGANSTEFDPETPFPVIDLLPEQKEVADLGGTMRLGADPVKLHEGTKIRELYGESIAYERHRHRYEVNLFLRKRLEAAGLIVGGTSPDERLVEAIELPDHPFYVAAQYHPEFKTRPERPAPLFDGFITAALSHGGTATSASRVPSEQSA
jgi:CTP synthase